MKSTFCIWNGNAVFIWPCVLPFLGNLSGISNCLAALHMNWLNCPAQSYQKFAPVKKVGTNASIPTDVPTGGGCCPFTSLACCVSCVYITLVEPDIFSSSKNQWRRRRSRVGTSMFNKYWDKYLIIIFRDVHGSCLTRVDPSFLLRFELTFKKYGIFLQFGPGKLIFILAFCVFFCWNFALENRYSLVLPESVGLCRSRKCRKSMSEVGGRSVGVGSRKKVSRPALHIVHNELFLVFCLRLE